MKKGRAELFAKGMGVGKLALHRHGWGVECHLDAAQVAFRDNFIRRAGFAARPIVGVQPYSRDSYKDHPEIARFIEALRADYDLILFHHVETSLPAAPGIASTVGLSLAQSIALVSTSSGDGLRGLGLPARRRRLRRAGRGDVRSDRREIVHATSSAGDRDLGQGKLRVRAVLAQRGPAVPADRPVRAKSLRHHAQGGTGPGGGCCGSPLRQVHISSPNSGFHYYLASAINSLAAISVAWGGINASQSSRSADRRFGRGGRLHHRRRGAHFA